MFLCLCLWRKCADDVVCSSLGVEQMMTSAQVWGGADDVICSSLGWSRCRLLKSGVEQMMSSAQVWG
jgi:hypothetical protein